MGKKSERECCFRWPRFDKQTILYNMCQKQFLPKKISMLCKIQAKCLELGGDVCSGITCDTWNCQGKRLNVVKFMKKMCTHSTHANHLPLLLHTHFQTIIQSAAATLSRKRKSNHHFCRALSAWKPRKTLTWQSARKNVLHLTHQTSPSR